jgi:protein-disulfide isomerase
VHPTEVTASDHVKGPANAPKTLIEYGDYECPFCVKAYPVIESVLASHPDSLRFVFRHVSRSTKGFEKQAAEAAEYAATEGKFWEMHHQLFTHPGQHDMEHLVGYATAIGCDAEKCRAALVDRRFAAHVRELAVAAAHAGIIGTPILFINDARFEDRIELEFLGPAIDRAAG